MAWGMINITSLPVGYLADEFGEQAVLAGEGIVLIGVVGVLWLLSRFIPTTRRDAARRTRAPLTGRGALRYYRA